MATVEMLSSGVMCDYDLSPHCVVVTDHSVVLNSVTRHWRHCCTVKAMIIFFYYSLSSWLMYSQLCQNIASYHSTGVYRCQLTNCMIICKDISIAHTDQGGTGVSKFW